MRALAAGVGRCCPGASIGSTRRAGRCGVPLLTLCLSSSATSSQQQVHSQPQRSTQPQLFSQCLYILDLLPLVYRYLPRDSSNGAPAPTAAAPPSAPPQPGQAGQQEAVVADPAEGVLASLLALTKRNVATPTHMAVAVDVPGATYRHRMYPQYKAHRRQHPPELTKAVSRILAVVDALGIPILAVPGAEADDVVGTLAAKAERDGFGNVVIVSPDRDFYQLLSPAVSVLSSGPYTDLYTLEDFTAQHELPDPRLWIDIKALMGDASDNIPGLKGVGQKTAMQLVQGLGPVEHVMQQLAAMPEEQQKQLVKLNKSQRALLQSEEGRVAVAFMKELVTINTALKAPPCQQPWSAYELKVPDDKGKRALECTQKLGMDWLYFRLQQYFARLATQA